MIARLRRAGGVVLLLGGLSLGACEPVGYGSDVVVTGPPAALYETVPVSPYAGGVWIAGHWNWDRGRYVWAPGYWHQPVPGYAWQPHRWGRVGPGWRFHPGYWRARPYGGYDYRYYRR